MLPPTRRPVRIPCPADHHDYLPSLFSMQIKSVRSPGNCRFFQEGHCPVFTVLWLNRHQAQVKKLFFIWIFHFKWNHFFLLGFWLEVSNLVQPSSLHLRLIVLNKTLTSHGVKNLLVWRSVNISAENLCYLLQTQLQQEFLWNGLKLLHFSVDWWSCWWFGKEFQPKLLGRKINETI